MFISLRQMIFNVPKLNEREHFYIFIIIDEKNTRIKHFGCTTSSILDGKFTTDVHRQGKNIDICPNSSYEHNEKKLNK